MTLAKHFFTGKAEALPAGDDDSPTAGTALRLTFPCFLRRWLRLHYLHGVVHGTSDAGSVAPSREQSRLNGAAAAVTAAANDSQAIVFFFFFFALPSPPAGQIELR